MFLMPIHFFQQYSSTVTVLSGEIICYYFFQIIISRDIVLVASWKFAPIAELVFIQIIKDIIVKYIQYIHIHFKLQFIQTNKNQNTV